MRVELLGPLRLRVDGVPVATGGPKLRALVALLALGGGRVVSVDDLLLGLWGEELPATARNALQQHVAVLRRALATAAAADQLATHDPGYTLIADTDVGMFLARASAATRAAAEGRHEEAATGLAQALNLWQGRAFADLRDFEFAQLRAVSLEGQRLVCLEAWAEAELACGRTESVVGPLQDLVGENPTAERLWEHLMLALYRTGRQDAALSAFRAARAALDRELGVAPTHRLSALHQAILVHDPRLQPLSRRPSRVRSGLSSTTLARSDLTGTPPVLVGPGGRRVELAQTPVVLGRHATCDLVLADEQASRRHARIDPVPAGYSVVDLGSTNGTFLNGTRLVGSMVLGHGDRIEVGHSLVRFTTPPVHRPPSGEPHRDLAR